VGGTSGIKKGFLLSFIFVIGLGAINFGYSIGVFNSMQKDFLIVFDIKSKEDRDTWVSIITTLCSLGAAIGSLTSGPFMRFGKKNCIHVTNLIIIIGCSLTLIKIKEVVAAGRFLFGLAAGAFSVFVPSFINEITPTELKGPFGSSTQLLITFGILIANLLGIPFPDCLDVDCTADSNPYKPGFIDDQFWRVLFAIPVGIAVIQSVLLFTVFSYETPKFLKMNGRKAELNAIMGRIYQPDQVSKRIEGIIVSTGGAESSPSYGETLTGARYKYATLIGCLLSMFQQLSGINFVMFYSSNIMGGLGISANMITALVGFVNFVSVFPTLCLFKRFGRKTLLWTHSFMIAGTLIALGVCLIIDA
jgi:MFS family permease